MRDPLSAMIEALGLEAAAIHEKGSGTQIELRGGERAGQAEGSWLYRFIVAEDLNLRDDTPVRVKTGQEDVSGVVVSFRDGVLTVALEKDLGPKIAAARLVADDAFLIERLKERLEAVRSGEAQFCRPAADRAIGRAVPTASDAEPDPAVIADGALDADQVRALCRALGSDTTFVWGPPGTGKTTTLARIVEAHYRAGRSVLLVSNTNIAVDTALERVAERLKDEPDFHQGLVIRKGPVVKEELRRRFGPQVILEEIVVRLGERLRREKEALSREAAALEQEERSLVAALRASERLTAARKTLSAREQARMQTQATVEARRRDAAHHRERAAKLAADIERARTMSARRRPLQRRRAGSRGLSPNSMRSCRRSDATWRPWPRRSGGTRRKPRFNRAWAPCARVSGRSASASPSSTRDWRTSSGKCWPTAGSSRRRCTAPTSERRRRASSMRS